ncbi:G protein-coupled receptor 137Ba-like [Dreissena polymorpha]|uniref:Integral membrane protein GPR137B n=1 Tax=Dreissena polymorpha TaxID=45954 RepID=A0A9D4L3K8_DREPO|nr:G protein-coupled receptor 137Ba-like [Dreissena polymorpha]KAH3851302.1 hypothetical protein DPMN_093782 [Dreissena polymorpha]
MFEVGNFSSNIQAYVKITTLPSVAKSTTTSDVTFPPPLKPALEPTFELGLTITFVSVYGLLFFMVYVQLWMIWYYRHKRFSYQTVFLFVTLIWSGLRMTLFSFYFKDSSRVNLFPVFTYWLLFCFPVCLQFIILCLLVLFFAQVVFKARARYHPSKFKRPLKVILVFTIIVFLTTNVICALKTKQYQIEKKQTTVPNYIPIIRVAVNDTLFIIVSLGLSVCIFKMAKMASASVVLETKGTTMCKALASCVVIEFVYFTRALYDVIALLKEHKKIPSFGYGWINVTDQADFVLLDEGYAYASFAIVLFVWEILPMFIVILFFRVKTSGSSKSLEDLPSHSRTDQPFFFDNPRRYDSDEDLLAPGIYQNSVQSGVYSVNSGDSFEDSIPPRVPTLGYGAVRTSDRQYSYSVSPAVLPPSLQQRFGSN